MLQLTHTSLACVVSFVRVSHCTLCGCGLIPVSPLIVSFFLFSVSSSSSFNSPLDASMRDTNVIRDRDRVQPFFDTTTTTQLLLLLVERTDGFRGTSFRSLSSDSGSFLSPLCMCLYVSPHHLTPAPSLLCILASSSSSRLILCSFASLFTSSSFLFSSFFYSSLLFLFLFLLPPLRLCVSRCELLTRRRKKQEQKYVAECHIGTRSGFNQKKKQRKGTDSHLYMSLHQKAKSQSE